jgi:hypothetical protein
MRCLAVPDEKLRKGQGNAVHSGPASQAQLGLNRSVALSQHDRHAVQYSAFLVLQSDPVDDRPATVHIDWLAKLGGLEDAWEAGRRQVCKDGVEQGAGDALSLIMCVSYQVLQH